MGLYGQDQNESRVTVKKDELLAVMRKNRSEHRGQFLAAQKGYRAAVIKELDAMLAQAREEGGQIKRSVSLAEPHDHTKDYDRVIKMLEMCVTEEITVTESQFNQYVLDEWGWKESFIGTNSNYTR